MPFFLYYFGFLYLGVGTRTKEICTLACLGFALWMHLKDDLKLACRGAELW